MKGCHVDQKHVKKVCTETLKKLTKLEVDKRTVFFQQRGNTLIHSFFELLAENKVSSEFPLFFSFCYIYLKVLSEFCIFLWLSALVLWGLNLHAMVHMTFD